MAFKVGHTAGITVATKDLSAFITNAEWDRDSDVSDVTTYGNGSHKYMGTLKDATLSLDGIYDSTATTGPKAVLEGNLGLSVAVILDEEGVGTGDPTSTFNAIVKKYTESIPVGDVIKFKCDLQVTGDVTVATQS
jgi:hypothetical protein